MALNHGGAFVKKFSRGSNIAVNDTFQTSAPNVYAVGDVFCQPNNGTVGMTEAQAKAKFDATIGIHPAAVEEFVTIRTPVGH